MTGMVYNESKQSGKSVKSCHYYYTVTQDPKTKIFIIGLHEHGIHVII